MYVQTRFSTESIHAPDLDHVRKNQLRIMVCFQVRESCTENARHRCGSQPFLLVSVCTRSALGGHVNGAMSAIGDTAMSSRGRGRGGGRSSGRGSYHGPQLPAAFVKELGDGPSIVSPASCVVPRGGKKRAELGDGRFGIADRKQQRKQARAGRGSHKVEQQRSRQLSQRTRKTEQVVQPTRPAPATLKRPHEQVRN